MTMPPRAFKVALAALCMCVPPSSPGRAAGGEKPDLAAIVARTVEPLMQRYGVPGMAVGVVVAGGESRVYGFGVMSKETDKPVTDETLFEIGSISKTFTATLASLAEVGGRLSLSDKVSERLPALRGGAFDAVSLLNLGTHTPGGMPLQFPDDVATDDQVMRYFREWKPAHAPGTVRTYANPSIGLLGVIAARSLDEDFATAMNRRVFEPLGLRRTYLHVPETEMAQYAQGYTKKGAPKRMAPGPLDSEAYGVRTTAGDLLRFVGANMGLTPVDGDLQRAITAARTGYFTVGPMTQDLIWEQYRYPVDLKDLLAGNAPEMGSEPNPAVRIDHPSPPRDDVLVNKTGSTSGFGAYVAFVPGKKIGVVLLANKNYPIAARVTAAYAILTRLAENAPGD